MKARITIDGQNVLTEATKESARIALLAIAKTANPIAKTAVNGASFFSNAAAISDKIRTMGDAESVVEFFELPEGKTAERLAARYTLGKFANRVSLAASSAAYVGEIFVEETDKKSAAGKPEQERDI